MCGSIVWWIEIYYIVTNAWISLRAPKYCFAILLKDEIIVVTAIVLDFRCINTRIFWGKHTFRGMSITCTFAISLFTEQPNCAVHMLWIYPLQLVRHSVLSAFDTPLATLWSIDCKGSTTCLTALLNTDTDFLLTVSFLFNVDVVGRLFDIYSIIWRTRLALITDRAVMVPVSTRVSHPSWCCSAASPPLGLQSTPIIIITCRPYIFLPHKLYFRFVAVKLKMKSSFPLSSGFSTALIELMFIFTRKTILRANSILRMTIWFIRVIRVFVTVYPSMVLLSPTLR